MEFFDNHKKLFGATAALFIGLTLLVAIFPALNNQKKNAVLPNAVPLSADAKAGKQIYIANGCVGCHTQQVRNVDMDRMWGNRPSIAADFAGITQDYFWQNPATLNGTERTGPDLINVGNRQASKDWQLVHLFNPRAVVKESIMPSYSWMFELKDNPGENDVVVNVPEEFLGGRKGKVVAKKEALQLVEYLLSLKQVELPDGSVPDFIYKKKAKKTQVGADGSTEEVYDGEALYATHCQSCHQASGEGLPGAFPPLKGSKIVLDKDPELFVNIIMNGYNGRASEGYGPMPNVGTMAKLTAEEITAIMNHERTSWGNDAEEVTVDQVKELMEKSKASLNP